MPEEKPFPVPILPPQILQLPDLRSNPDLRSERPTTYRLSHDTAFKDGGKGKGKGKVHHRTGEGVELLIYFFFNHDAR